MNSIAKTIVNPSFFVKFLTFIIVITLTLQGNAINKPSIPYQGKGCRQRKDQTQCMVCNTWHEARGEPDRCQVEAVRSVLKRQTIIKGKSGKHRYPTTNCGAVLERAQYSWTLPQRPKKGKKKRSTSLPNKGQSLKVLAKTVANTKKALGMGPSNCSTHYHKVSVHPSWANSCRRCFRCGLHIFYDCTQVASLEDETSNQIVANATSGVFDEEESPPDAPKLMTIAESDLEGSEPDTGDDDADGGRTQFVDKGENPNTSFLDWLEEISEPSSQTF